MEIERRFTATSAAPSPVKVRDSVLKNARIIVGYASVYYRAGEKGTEFNLAEDIVERIHQGAFDRVLRASDLDVRALFNHDPSRLLGRSTARTLRLSSDKYGLRYEIDADPDTTTGRDIVAHLKRRDVTGSSFAFITRGDDVEWTEERGVFIRNVRSISALFDVGPVTYPAYAASESGLRSLALVRAERDAWLSGGADASRMRLIRARAKLATMDI